jgi:hypothetical protein
VRRASRSPDPGLAGLLPRIQRRVAGQELAASLRVCLRDALVKSTVVGFPLGKHQFGVCAHPLETATWPTAADAHGISPTVMPRSC